MRPDTGWWSRIAWVAGTALAYYGSARLGLRLALVGSQVTPLWFPTGVAVSALLLNGARNWPGVAVAAFAVNLPLSRSVPEALLIAAGNTVGPWVAYLLLRRVGFRNQLSRVRDAVALVFLGALAGMLVSATCGAAVLTLFEPSDTGGFWSAWSVWWTGDAMGVLTVTPFALLVASLHRPRALGDVPARGLLGGLALTVAAAVVISAGLYVGSMLFLVFPLLIWLAFRFQLAGCAPASLAVCTTATYLTASGIGVFAHGPLLTGMARLQAFNGTAVLTSLLLSAVVAQRNAANREIVRACRELSAVVRQLTETDRPPDQ